MAAGRLPASTPTDQTRHAAAGRRSRRDGTVYTCGSCESRYLGEQWCHDCNRPSQRLGTGGTCPSCEEVVLIEELTGDQDADTPSTNLPPQGSPSTMKKSPRFQGKLSLLLAAGGGFMWRRPPADSTESAGGRAAYLPIDTSAEVGASAPQPVDEPATATASPDGQQSDASAISGVLPVAAAEDHRRHGHRRASRWPRRLAVAALGAGLVGLGGGGALVLWGQPAPPAPVEVGTIPAANAARPALPSVPAPSPAADPTAAAPSAPSPVTPPVHLQVPAIKVDTPLVPLGLQHDGTVAVPTNFAEAGWYDEGTLPGDPGPAVMLGHIDSYKGPAVFYRLRELHPGDEVVIGRVDGSTVRFAVDAVRQFPKDSFPTDLVYGDTAAPTLRLITCGGSFDRATRNYLDNVVVFAHELSDDGNAPVASTAPTPAAPPPTGPAPVRTP